MKKKCPVCNKEINIFFHAAYNAVENGKRVLYHLDCFKEKAGDKFKEE